MRTVKIISLALACFFLTFLFQNCGELSAENSNASLSSLCKAQKAQNSPFLEQKIHISHFNKSGLQKLSSHNQKLSLVIDNRCLAKQNKDLTFLGQNINVPQRTISFAKTAVQISLPDNISLTQIENEINKTACIVGLADNIEIKTTQSSAPTSVNDPQASQQKHLDFMGYYDSQSLQNKITEKVVVAIVDTGVDYTHFDLKERMWTNSAGLYGDNFTGGLSRDPMDDDGHGTHVAGILAAKQNNSFGVSGLLHDFVEIMAIKSLNAGGSGTSQSVYNGIQYAIANGAHIINLSLEAPGANALLEDALIDAINAGIVVTVATGNQGEEITANNLFAPAYIGPSLDGVLSVSSIDISNSGLSFFSNYSRTYAEISGPGSEQPATLDQGILSTAPADQVSRIPGTSQATPMVASAAAIIIGFLKTNNIQYTPGAIEKFIKSDGSASSSSLASFIEGGRIVNIKFLSQNLNTYAQTGLNQLDFTGDSTGGSCTVK